MNDGKTSIHMLGKYCSRNFSSQWDLSQNKLQSICVFLVIGSMKSCMDGGESPPRQHCDWPNFSQSHPTSG